MEEERLHGTANPRDAGSVREKALTLALSVYIGWYAAAMMGFVEYPLQTLDWASTP